MSEISEAIEKAEEGEHGEGFNRKIALVIAILALFLSFCRNARQGRANRDRDQEYPGVGPVGLFPGQGCPQDRGRPRPPTRPLSSAPASTDPAAKAALDKQVEDWRKTAERYESDPKTGNGRKELEEQAKDAEQSATWRRRNITITNWHRRHSRSASCWLRRR